MKAGVKMPPKKGPKKAPKVHVRSLMEFDEDRHLEEIMDDIKNGVVHVDEELHPGAAAASDSDSSRNSSSPDEVNFIFSQMMDELESNPLINPTSPGRQNTIP